MDKVIQSSDTDESRQSGGESGKTRVVSEICRCLWPVWADRKICPLPKSIYPRCFRKGGKLMSLLMRARKEIHMIRGIA